VVKVLIEEHKCLRSGDTIPTIHSQVPRLRTPLQEIAIDFMGELPKSDIYNTILVITDGILKIQYYIPTKTS